MNFFKTFEYHQGSEQIYQAAEKTQSIGLAVIIKDGMVAKVARLIGGE